MDASRENVMEACDNENNNKQLQILKSRRPQLNTLQHNIDMYDTRSDVTDMSLMYVFIY
jgi:hypothetical protein